MGSEPTQAHLARAQQIADKHMALHGQFPTLAKRLAADIAAALAEQVPPKGSIVDDTGAARKVLGTLPITKDGVVAMDGVEVFHPNQDWHFGLTCMRLLDETQPDKDFPLPEDCEYMGHYSYWEPDTGYGQYESYDIRECYSTKEAALAAQPTKEPTNGK